MKKRLFTCLMIVMMIVTSLFTGCGDAKVDTTNAPDYSASEKSYDLWSYGSVCDNWYMLNGKKYYFEEGSLQTKEHTKQLKDCGFNIMFIDYTFGQSSMTDDNYNFHGTKLEKVMDMAQEEGMKCIVYQPDLHAYSNFKESRINPEKAKTDKVNYVSSQEELNERVGKMLKGLVDHPALYGVTLIDEPSYEIFQCMGEIYQAIQTVKPGLNVMMNLLPYVESHKLMYSGDKTLTAPEAYKSYLETYYEKLGKYSGYIQYDDYPILNNGILGTYFNGASYINEIAKKYNLERRMVHQTCTYADRRQVKDPDMWWQSNMSMAMGCKEFSYYTYYPTVNTNGTLPDENHFIVNRHGEPNPLYYTIKDIHKEMRFMEKPLMNFNYNAMNYEVQLPLETGNFIPKEFNKDEMQKLTSFTFKNIYGEGGVLFVTELYDSTNDRYGYYVVNATDPMDSSELKVDLEFSGYKQAQIYQHSVISNVNTDNGKIQLYLGTGRGAFVIPY